MVMGVVMVVVAATAAISTSTSTTAAAALVRKQAGGRWAWSGDQERRSGHDGQKQSLAKHQRSPHLVKFLRRVNWVEHLLPQEPEAVGSEFRASFQKTRFDSQIARQAISVICDNCADAAM
jgi:hypothetical protein